MHQMATRTPRGRTPTEPPPQVSSTDSRPTSPLSQVLSSRAEEKHKLQTLNDRLAQYIEVVRNLQLENESLLNRSQTIEDSSSKEIQNLRAIFEKEMAELRDARDKALRDKNSIEAEMVAERSSNEQNAVTIAKMEKELSSLKKEAMAFEKELKSLRSTLTDELAKNRRLDEEKSDLAKGLDDLRKRLNALQKEAAREAALRADAENKLASAQQQLAMEKRLMEEELSYSHSQKLELETSLDRQYQDQYQQRLGEELASLREEHEEKLKACRTDLEQRYEAEIAQLKDRLKQRSTAETKLRSEFQVMSSKLDAAESQAKHLDGVNKSLNERIKDLENILKQERTWHEAALLEKEKEVNSLHEKIKENMKDYQDLYDVKVALDFEIDAYRKLLDGEESRLSLSDRPASRASSASSLTSPLRGKRKGNDQIVVQDEYHTIASFTNGDATGEVEINDHDGEGQYVQITNTGEKDISLGGWQLVRVIGADQQATVYKFNRSIVIKPKSKITVWSAGVKGKTHNPPSDLVMKNQTWTTAPEMLTNLLDSEGKVSLCFSVFHPFSLMTRIPSVVVSVQKVSWLETKVKRSKRLRNSDSRLSVGADKNCSIM